MKKALRIILLTCGILLISVLSFAVYAICLAKDVNLDKNKLINLDRKVIFYDIDGQPFAEETNGVSVTENKQIPMHTKNAFIAIEDKRFYAHNGIDFRSILRATAHNVKTLSLKEGASTISQQLIKNTHLNSKKTLKRKIKEIKLTRELEKTFTKDEILEKYLNTIYFGDNCYGITSATRHYFNKLPSELTLNESATLAGIVKAPSTYSPTKNPDKSKKRKNLVLKKMYEQGYINKEEYDENAKQSVCITCESAKDYDFMYLARKEVDEIIKNRPYLYNDVKVMTSYQKDKNLIIKDKVNDFSSVNTNKSVILMDKFGNIIAYYSTCGDINRQLGSVLKPVAVYAPAIDSEVVNSCTYILDEKTDFNGYSPSNYNEEYCGQISVKDSLAKSSNVCAVKLLNYVGFEKVKQTLSKMDISLSDEDYNLSLALGASSKGAKLSQITACYNIFSNDGIYSSPTTISAIKYNGKSFVKTAKKKVKIIETSTASIMNDMLKNVVENGTAKKLKYCNFPLYAKTGTVGNKNGNTDTYVVSYNNEYTLGVWFGGVDGELMDNGVTGGTYPALLSAQIWNELYNGSSAPKEIENKNVNEILLDKISYVNDKKLILADENSPERFVIKALVKNPNTIKEKSTRFSCPSIEKPKILVNNNEIKLTLRLTEYCDALVFKYENGKKRQVYDTKNKSNIFIDKLNNLTVCQYSVMPYFENNGEIFYGNEVLLDKIKAPNGEFGDEWWKNDFE